MKKYLLSILLIGALATTKAQNVLLNELYVSPSAGHQEYFELHNTSFVMPGENLDCYTLVTYFTTDTERGFYVLDLPNVNITPGGYFVGASQKVVHYGDSVTTADYSWNDAAYMSTHSASTRKYVLNSSGNGYTIQTGTYNDVFSYANNGGNGNNRIYAAFLFYQGNIVDVFMGANPNTNIPNYIADMPDLPTGSLACSANTVDFSTLDADQSIVSNSTPVIQDDQNFYRENNNRCGVWKKGTNQSYLTPGMANPRNNALDIVTDVTFSCDLPTFSYDITHAPSSALPITASLYYDMNGDTAWSPVDVLIGTHTDLTLADPIVTYNVAAGASLILVITGADAMGCSNAIYYFSCPQGGPLPVNLKSFNVSKMGAGASLVWQTAGEYNNRGFEVLRRTNTGGFESIGFVNSQALNGTSATGYTYQFNDLTRLTKGTTYYRLRQVDIDNRSLLSDIKALRVDGSAEVLIYPNPSNDGNPKLVLPSDGGRMDVTVLDMTGKVIQQYNDVRDSNVQLHNLRQGMYAVRIYFATTGEQVVQKLIVQ